MSVQQALSRGMARLKEAGIDDPGRDARRLMAWILGIAPGRLTLHLHDALDPLAETEFCAAIAEREKRRPLSHLLGYRAFHGHRFRVTPDVLDPRGDTETLVEAALGVAIGCWTLAPDRAVSC